MNKGPLLPVILVLLTVFGGSIPFAAKAQDGGQVYQVQALVDGLLSTRHAYRADLVLREQAGVRMSRTDLNTRNLLMHVTADCALDQDIINALLAPLGVSIQCFRRVPLETGTYRHLPPGPCEEAPANR